MFKLISIASMVILTGAAEASSGPADMLVKLADKCYSKVHEAAVLYLREMVQDNQDSSNDLKKKTVEARLRHLRSEPSELKRLDRLCTELNRKDIHEQDVCYLTHISRKTRHLVKDHPYVKELYYSTPHCAYLYSIRNL